ncbi:hypothetical protein [Endozoicomonas sp. GU-1]|uniref:hypothetical protein n=1 Tax=Endozoicomonas sp. GU-1 TaxID=3009078 RepID=UPI0022B51CCA|nr:hypothetical protein [Endozoicomonas sp. GU-1]WBA81513.1 hypothetical protein O2T12_25110 [Endozoicomonas sp. GU-1]WBA84461.1 hypothetical protein O3276_14270 [Endozoicomonas sp. GU-1]
MNRKILVIASAGGHLTQALCATALCDEIVLVTNKKNISNVRIRRIYKIFDTQKNPIIHFINIFFAIIVLLRERPKSVFSTGGPICLPFALLCKLFRIRFVYLDTLSRVVELSNSGKLIYRFKLYNCFICQWKDVAQQYEGIEYYGTTFDLSDHGE